MFLSREIDKNCVKIIPKFLYIQAIYKFGLSVCLFVCLSVCLYPINAKTENPRNFCENPRIIFVLFYDVHKENMFTINLEDGREAPSKASLYIKVVGLNRPYSANM